MTKFMIASTSATVLAGTFVSYLIFTGVVPFLNVGALSGIA